MDAVESYTDEPMRFQSEDAVELFSGSSVECICRADMGRAGILPGGRMEAVDSGVRERGDPAAL